MEKAKLKVELGAKGLGSKVLLVTPEGVEYEIPSLQGIGVEVNVTEPTRIKLTGFLSGGGTGFAIVDGSPDDITELTALVKELASAKATVIAELTAMADRCKWGKDSEPDQGLFGGLVLQYLAQNKITT